MGRAAKRGGGHKGQFTPGTVCEEGPTTRLKISGAFYSSLRFTFFHYSKPLPTCLQFCESIAAVFPVSPCPGRGSLHNYFV